ncbi:prolyl oligopeptidase family protein [Acidisphaera sp. L21]|uniref:prolyl oligopeptidase family serine peptidase n=1 Tax=Acidisphaera sp. L21 TaxID=1641851 RepID=UPI00131CB92A|nr:prolyl oligopeptidase family serine peptidase [Acidisphaera sp. L21]
MTHAAPTLDTPDDDPWLWLEDVEGDRATVWADAQTAATIGAFGGAAYAADRDTLRALLDRPDNLPVPGRRGGLLYNYWRDAQHPRGVWRRTDMASYCTDAPNWDVLLDLDAFATHEGEDWVWQGAATLPPAHDRAIMRLSRGGSDAVVLREFDMTNRSFVPDGFNMPESKGGAAWIDRDTVLLASAAQGVTNSGYASTVRLWSRGQAPGPALFQTDAANMAAWGQYDSVNDWLLFGEATDFFNGAVFIGDRNGPNRKIDLPSDSHFLWDRGWMAIKLRSPWTVGETTYAGDTLLVIGLDAFLAGDRAFKVLFEPAPRRALQNFGWVGGVLLIGILDELRPVILVVQPGTWESHALDGMPAVGTAGAWGLDIEDIESDGTLLATVQDPLTPPTLMMIPPGPGAPIVLKRTPPAFDASGLVVTRHEAICSDGERIPYVQSGPPGETGDAPVHMTGYGGFGVTSNPTYALRTGKLWLERGGTTVIANIRGGGEFGTRWHDAGRREGKKLSHDDFAAVAADLVRRGITRPGRIAAEGGSNGGLLIANMLTRFPERFGALFCTIPLIDMRRYSQLLAGASWIAEYGDPAIPDDWAFLGPISAYHAAAPGQPYPPILLATARRDDRVHPGHARKMAAKLQAMGYNAHFYEPAAGGHGYGKDNAEVAAFSALGIAFLRKAIGWE